ncbi:glycosyltransferase family 2 protein [Sphingomonas kaistensis]|uniref:Glycosyltransferase family 2 protein n=1 Tax=Sphingomonas kaistensis TaxID=298708 RepID=A0ABZ2G138_9SPHN
MTDVSIIIPTFNRAPLLGEAIDSALAQGGDNEVIVVDDGSTDDTPALLARYGDRISVLRQQNQGPSAARNLAANAARGEYLFFADSDDLIEPDAVSMLLGEARRLGPGNIPFGHATTIDGSGRPCAGTTYGFSSARNGDAFDLAALLSGTMPLGLTLLPAPMFRDLGGLRRDLRLGEDHEFSLRVYAAGFRYVASDIPTIRVRLHDAPRLSGIANERFGHRAITLWSAISELAARLPDFDERAREALATLIWIAGRDAARARSRQAANHLFAMAKAIDRRAGRSDPLLLRVLGTGIGAYRTERVAERIKRLVRRR